MSEIQILDKEENLPTQYEAPENNPAFLYLLSLGTKQSREKMKRVLLRVASELGYSKLESNIENEDQNQNTDPLLQCPWGILEQKHVLLVKTKLSNAGLAPSTINLHVCSMRAVARQAWVLGQMTDHQERTIAAVRGAKGTREPRGRELSRYEISLLLSKCYALGTECGVRDAAIIALGIGGGLRRTEIAGATLSGLDFEEHSLRLIGKGNKERTVYLSESVWEHLNEWLKIRGEEGCDNIFVPVKHGTHIKYDFPISDKAVYQTLMRRTEQFGTRPFKPHDLRRTYATRLLDMGADLNSVREAMGHSSVQTTQRYDQSAKKRARTFTENIQI